MKILAIFFSLIFILMQDLSLMTFCLLMNMLLMILILFFVMNFQWVSLLYGITVVSGLMVIFAYISSISPKNPVISVKKVNFFCVFLLLCSVFSLIDFSFFLEKKNFFFHDFDYVKYTLIVEGFFLFSLLFLLIIIFLRLTYSKGGSFRKKF
uniref:NADH dehydrogenase subunit 6 n=1 Tax=Ricinus sp. ADS-2020 TaxID=2794903 RepID=A0A7T1HF11_9NEOP|nr:NADH dehydrogenase subunit 6 [Ricinus sp. ADS-2020]